MTTRPARLVPNPAATVSGDHVVTMEELRASSRVRFWVPPQLMEQFFDSPIRHPIKEERSARARAQDTDGFPQPELACSATR